MPSELFSAITISPPLPPALQRRVCVCARARARACVFVCVCVCVCVSLLSLVVVVVVTQEAYSAWKEQALASMAAHPSRQQKLLTAFEKLMLDVPRGKQANLDVKTRDKFTQNLSQFRMEVRTLM